MRLASRVAATISACLAVCLAGVVTVGAQAAGGVRGSVTDAAGKPLADVTITLSGPSTFAARSGADGQFVIEGVPDGEYMLTAELEGFAIARRTVLVVKSRARLVPITMEVRAVEEVTVSADRTGERPVSEVPLAVSVLSETDLERSGARTIADLAGQAPSMTFAQNTGYAQLTIRGIGTNAVFAGSDPSSVVYLDGVYLARPSSVLGDFLDVERIEILRGPQGTLYGRNAVGGAINVLTRAPTNERELSARVLVGSLGTARAQVHASGPLVPGRIMASAEVLRGVARGYVEDLLHPDNTLGGNDVTAGRGALRVVFNPRSEFRLSGDFSHRDPAPLYFTKVLAVKPGFTVDNPDDPREVRTSTPARGRLVQYGILGHFTWRPTSSLSLTSLTAYRDLDYDFQVDSDITELNIVATEIHETHHQVSQEVIVNGEGARVQWTAGAFFFTDVDRQPTVTAFMMPRQVSTLRPVVDGTSTAMFGQLRLGLSSKLAAVAGLRYSRDRKTMDNSGGVELGDMVVSSFQYRDTTASTAWTPKFGVEYQQNDRSLVYATATRGFKTGGFNLTATRASDSFAPEWVWSYEAGLKVVSPNRRTNLGVSAYVSDYTDLQVQTSIRPGLLEITNAASATIRGVEIEGSSRLGAGWHAGGHLAWLDARYDQYLAVNANGSTIDVAGRRLSNAPGWSGRAWLEHTGRIWRSGVISRVEWLQQSTVFFTPVNDTLQRQRPYGLVAASVTIQPSRWWSVGVYGRNLTATDYITGTNSAPPPAVGARPGEPRQMGVQFSITR